MKILAVISLVCLFGVSEGFDGCDSSAPCQNGGICNAAGECQCTPKFVGNLCELVDCKDVGIDPCLNGGTCVTVNGEGSCSCAQGFTGNLCETVGAEESSSSTKLGRSGYKYSHGSKQYKKRRYGYGYIYGHHG